MATFPVTERPANLSLFAPERGALADAADYLPNPVHDLPPEARAAMNRGYVLSGVFILGGAVGRAAGWALARLGLAARAGVPLARALESGLVKSGGKLAQVLGGIEKGYGVASPKNALDALNVVRNATSAAGLEPGVATVAKTGEIVLQNVGGVATTLGTNGSILVQRGSDVLLHLLP